MIALLRTFIAVILILAAGALVFYYFDNPEDFKKSAGEFKDAVMAIFAGPTQVSNTSRVAPAPTPTVAPALAEWAPPAVIPAQPHWTWTTSQGIYQDVKIVKIEADRVTIIHSEGGGVVPMSALPADIQKQLNYDPAAATAAVIRRGGQ